MRVMLDTNIIISYILFNNDKMNLFFNHILSHDNLVISNIIIDELKEVFNRKFSKKIESLNKFLDDLEADIINVENVDDGGLFSIRDIKDYPVLHKIWVISYHFLHLINSIRTIC